MMPTQSDLRKQICQELLKSLEQGVLVWRRPWAVSHNTGLPANAQSGRKYTGINPLLLELHARKHGFTSRHWCTFQGWQSLGMRIKKRPASIEKGSWGCKVIYFTRAKKTTVDPATGEESETHFPLMRTYTLFNADQVSGPGAENYQATEPLVKGESFIGFGPAERFIRATGMEVRHGGDKAFYVRPIPDGSWPNHNEGHFIQVPDKVRFSPAAEYYLTVCHELIHAAEIETGWGYKQRGYALGELAAEIGSCYLASELGIPQREQMENHAAYIQSWMKEIENDSRFLFVAASQASKAADFLLSFVAQPAESETVGIQAA